MYDYFQESMDIIRSEDDSFIANCIRKHQVTVREDGMVNINGVSMDYEQLICILEFVRREMRKNNG